MGRIRKTAKGQRCQVRLLDCKGGEGVVFAHYRLAGYSGTGTKPPDVPFGAFACGHCHDLIDGRVKSDHDQKILRLAHAEGCLRTQHWLLENGYIQVPEK